MNQSQPRWNDAQAEEFLEAPHSVVASTAEMSVARALIEDLEEHGVPPRAIALIGAAPGGSMDDTTPGGDAETEAIDDLGRSVAVGGAAGAAAGGVLGSAVTLAIPGVGLVVAAGLGAIFGAGVGGSAGGMSVAKYNSPAWTETFETVERGEVAVGVHHADRSVVDAAAEIIERHRLLSVERYDEDDDPQT